MPVVEAVQTFVGSVNENEFYSHHYLSEVFKGDIRERLEQWAAVEESHPAQRAPFKQLASWPASGRTPGEPLRPPLALRRSLAGPRARARTSPPAPGS